MGHCHESFLRHYDLGLFYDNLLPLANERVENLALRPPNIKSLVINQKALRIFLGDGDTIRRMPYVDIILAIVGKKFIFDKKSGDGRVVRDLFETNL